jgi:predicted dehydrogenase
MAAKYRIGIAGLDHWYAGLAAAESAAKNPLTEIVAIAHRHPGQLAETATKYGVAATTANYREIAQRDDVDIVVTACYCNENPALVAEAARNGKHIVSVKPVALDVAGADAIVEAVRAAKVKFISNENTFLVSPAYQRIKTWIDEGRIGKPITAHATMRASIPRTPWPGQRGETWWLDKTKSPGGGWIDHSIYYIAVLRWFLGAEVTHSSGEIANVVDQSLKSRGLEDYGVANVRFSGGQIATVEVTWHAPPGGSYYTFQIVGTEGQIVWDETTSGKIAAVGKFDVPGWFQVNPGPRAGSVLDHLVDCLETGKNLVSNELDSRNNLAACLDFYKSARSE